MNVSDVAGRTKQPREEETGSFHSASGTGVGCACEDDRGRVRAESADSTAHAARIRTRRPFLEPEIERNEMVLEEEKMVLAGDVPG